MKIYTSYFGNLKNIRAAGIIPVSIARYSPKWFSGIKYIQAAPYSYMLSEECGREEYIRRYKGILQSLNPQLMVETLMQISGGSDIALLCFEKPGEFCHRHLLAAWLSENTEYDVKEFGQEKNQEEIAGENQQLSLF